jgi:epsilon-lactone hydrolase
MASPELAQLLARLRATKISGAQPIDEMRVSWDKFATAFPPAPDLSFASVAAGGVPSEWVSAPGADESRIVLYLHGGGYCIGTLASCRNFAGRVCRSADARVLSVGYRLAPENPFPAAVEDALASYRWLLHQGIPSSRVALLGDSAGGGLALATAVALRDANDPLPAAIVAVGPLTDLAKESPSMKERAHLDPIVTYEGSMANALRYVGQNGDLKNPLASPLHAALEGLPRMLILVGTHECLFDDSTRFANKAKAAGVPVELDIWEEMIHDWPLFADVLPEGRAAIEKMGRYIRAAIPTD